MIRVVVRQKNYDKIAHKIDKTADYNPEIVFENASVVELDPRDHALVARINQNPKPQLVTVRDEVDLPVITAFRLLAVKLQPRRPILLEDVLKWRTPISVTLAAHRAR